MVEEQIQLDGDTDLEKSDSILIERAYDLSTAGLQVVREGQRSQGCLTASSCSKKL